ncbi:MAG: NAD(P)H-binding protein [Rhodospirillales bacterium]|nr:NAD(P)H-binding protein [Rhodospirillales bacterium]
MRILVTGACGFIGGHITSALIAAGHRVVCCVRDPARARRMFPGQVALACDFNRDTEAACWRPRLEDVDAVINCAGILQSRPGQSIAAIHGKAPKALFDACLAAGVRRVIQISALGAEPQAGTAYALSKHEADLHLLSLPLDGTVVQPSLAYTPAGSYGGTSLFRALAALPWLVPVVGRGDQSFQPIHMADLAEGVHRLVERPGRSGEVIAAVGPRAVTFTDLLLALRRWLGLPPARVFHVPQFLAGLAARLGDLFGGGPLTTTSLRMLNYGNTADPAPFIAATGVNPRTFEGALETDPAQVQDLWHARLYFLRPLLRTVLAVFWIATGMIAVLASSGQSEAFLSRAGVAPSLVPFALWGGALTDMALGALLLIRWRVRLIGGLQLLVTAVYLGALTVAWPALWADPLGPLLKTLPLVLATLVMIAIEEER